MRFTFEQALEILDKLKAMGFEENWPPSPSVWHFQNKDKGVRLNFFWSNCKFRANLEKKQIKWSDKHNRYIAD